MGTRILKTVGLAAILSMAMVGQAFAVIDYSTVTSGLQSAFESGVTQVLRFSARSWLSASS